MGKSIKSNFLFNLVNTLAGLLFPLVTFPYAARILDPDGIGVINFYQSILSYITLFTGIGLALYAVRALAAVRDNKQLLSQYTVEILSLHMLLILLGYVAVVVLCTCVDEIEAGMKIFIILSSSLFFNAIGASWFFQAVEDFKYITVRSLIVKALSAVALFTLVKDKADIGVYAVILAVADAGNNVMNFVRLRRYVKKKTLKFSELKILRHLKPSLKIFSLNVIVSLYIQMSPVLLGFMTDNTMVGYFTAASRIQLALLSVVTALGTTLLPRMSYYFSVGDIDRFRETEHKGMSFILLVSCPIVAGLILVADTLIPLFAGAEYVESIVTMRIISPTILFIGVSGLLGMQVLYPQGKESIVIRTTACGAIVSLIVSVLMIPRYGHNGAAAGFVAAEFTVTGLMMVWGRKYYNYRFFTRDNVVLVAACIIMSVSVFMSGYLKIDSNLVKLAVEITVGVVMYVTALRVLKNRVYLDLQKMLTDKIRSYVR